MHRQSVLWLWVQQYRQIFLASAVVHDGSLDAHHYGLARNAIQTQVAQVIDLPHGNMKDHIVATTYQKDALYFRDGFHLYQEPIDGISFISRQFDEGERLQTHPNRTRFDLCVSSANDPRRAKVLDPFVARRRSKAVVFLLTMLLVRGVTESAEANNVMVAIKV